MKIPSSTNGVDPMLHSNILTSSDPNSLLFSSLESFISILKDVEDDDENEYSFCHNDCNKEGKGGQIQHFGF